MIAAENVSIRSGIRKGRKVEPGAVVLSLNVDGQPANITLVEASEERSEVRVPAGIRLPLRVTVNDNQFLLEEKDGKVFVPSRLLWTMHRPEFAIVGYDLTTKDREDPVKFLRRFQADTNPAPLQATK